MLPQYLLESSLCLAIFYLFYHLALRRQTFFQLNRGYLLLTPLLSLLIPLAEWEWSPVEPAPAAEYVLPVWTQWEVIDYSVQATMAQTPPGFRFQLNDLMLAIYLAGAFFMLLQLLQNLQRVRRLIAKGKKSRKSGFILVETSEGFPAASFFSYVFWKESREDLDKVVLTHESVHVRQRHSLDVILMECLLIVQWFNPWMYAFRKKLKETHEYIADAYVSKKLGSSHQYARCLLEQNQPTVNFSITHSFAAMLPKRLKMLARPRSAFWRYFNYLIVVPMIGLMILLFAYNFSSKLSPELSKRLETEQTKLKRLGLTTLFSTSKADIPKVVLVWGDQSCHCFPGQLPTFYRCENLRFSAREFTNLLRNGNGFTLFQDDSPLKFEELEIFSKKTNLVKSGDQASNFLNDFQPDSPLGQAVGEGDILKFAFKTEAAYWVEFNAVIQGRGQKIDYAYDVYIGDFRIPLEMTTLTGVKYLDYETFEGLKDQSLRIVKNYRKPVRITSINMRENSGFRRESVRELNTTEIELPDYAIWRNMRQGRLSFSIRSQTGEKFNFSLAVNQGPFYDEALDKKFSPVLLWGEERMPVDASKSFKPFVKPRDYWLELLDQPMRLVVNETTYENLSFRQLIVFNTADRAPESYISQDKLNTAELKKELRRILMEAKEEEFIRIDGQSSSDGYAFGFALQIQGER